MNVLAFQPRPTIRLAEEAYALLRFRGKRTPLPGHTSFDGRQSFKQHACVLNVRFSWIEQGARDALAKVEAKVPLGECVGWELKDKPANVSTLLQLGRTPALYVADVHHLLSRQPFGQEGFLLVDGSWNAMLVAGNGGALAILLARFAADAMTHCAVGSFKAWELELDQLQIGGLYKFPVLSKLEAGHQFICRDVRTSDIVA